MNFIGLIFLLFLGLKLAGLLTWAWVWILAPLWLPIALVALFACAIGFAGIIAVFLEGKRVKT